MTKKDKRKLYGKARRGGSVKGDLFCVEGLGVRVCGLLLRVAGCYLGLGVAT